MGPPLTPPKGRELLLQTVLPLEKGELEGDENPLNPKILRKESCMSSIRLHSLSWMRDEKYGITCCRGISSINTNYPLQMIQQQKVIRQRGWKK